MKIFAIFSIVLKIKYYLYAIIRREIPVNYLKEEIKS